MRWKQFAFWILATALATSETAAQDLTNLPIFRQWITNQTRFSFVGGRVVVNTNNGAWMFGTQKQVSTEGPAREQVNVNGNGVTGSLAYTYQRNGDQADPAERSESGVCR